MNDGQLVKWSYAWLADCDEVQRERYRVQIGIVTNKCTQTWNCWTVVWSNGATSSVHRDFLEVL